MAEMREGRKVRPPISHLPRSEQYYILLLCFPYLRPCSLYHTSTAHQEPKWSSQVFLSDVFPFTLRAACQLFLKMASDLEQRMSFAEETRNLIEVPECLIHMERRAVPHGAGGVDKPEAISAELTGYVRSKAHCLVVHFREEGAVLKTSH